MKLTAPFLFCLVLSGCAVLTDSQVKNINAFAATAKSYSAFPSVVLKERAELHLHNEFLTASQFTDADKINHRLDTARKYYNTAVQLSAQFDLSLQLIQQYAGLLAKLSGDNYISGLSAPTTELGQNLCNLVSVYNSKAKDSLPLDLGTSISKVVLLVGKELTKRKQTEALKEFVLASDTLVQVTMRNLLEAMDGVGELLSIERDLFVQNYRNVVFAHPDKINYESVKSYYDELTAYNDTELLCQGVVKAAKSLAQAHAALAKNVQTKKDLKEIIGQTQQLITDVQPMGPIFSQFVKLP